MFTWLLVITLGDVEDESEGYMEPSKIFVKKQDQHAGLEIKDLRKQNISLMVKWWWKLETQNGLWQNIVRARYLRNISVAEVSPKFSEIGRAHV